MLLTKLVEGLSQPKAAAQFLIEGEKGRTLTAEEAFFGWLMTLPLESKPQKEALSALKKLEALPSPGQSLRSLIMLFRQASLPTTRTRRSRA